MMLTITGLILVIILAVILLRFGRAIALGLLALAGLAVLGLLALATLNQSWATRQAVELARPRWTATAGWVLALLIILAIAAAATYLAVRWAVRERRLRHELERNLGSFGSRRDRSGAQLPHYTKYPTYPMVYDLDDIEAPDAVDEPLW
ncbi:MAG: hypothetical protein GF383_16665, partial [Candidatus Lokiarchaeota archaeon]|nr:hypothetical protein [Candidatus Lokiarchaeota archaeon]